VPSYIAAMTCVASFSKFGFALSMLIGSTFPQERIEPNVKDLNDDINVDNDENDDQDNEDIIININDRCEAIMSYMLN
jgi:hypothetical protein